MENIKITMKYKDEYSAVLSGESKVEELAMAVSTCLSGILGYTIRLKEDDENID